MKISLCDFGTHFFQNLIQTGFWVIITCINQILDWHYLTRVWQRRHWRDLEDGLLNPHEIIIEFDYMKKIDLEKYIYHKGSKLPSCVPILKIQFFPYCCWGIKLKFENFSGANIVCFGPAKKRRKSRNKILPCCLLGRGHQCLRYKIKIGGDFQAQRLQKFHWKSKKSHCKIFKCSNHKSISNYFRLAVTVHKTIEQVKCAISFYLASQSF